MDVSYVINNAKSLAKPRTLSFQLSQEDWERFILIRDENDLSTDSLVRSITLRFIEAYEEQCSGSAAPSEEVSGDA